MRLALAHLGSTHESIAQPPSFFPCLSLFCLSVAGMRVDVRSRPTLLSLLSHRPSPLLVPFFFPVPSFSFFYFFDEKREGKKTTKTRKTTAKRDEKKKRSERRMQALRVSGHVRGRGGAQKSVRCRRRRRRRPAVSAERTGSIHA